MSFLSLSSLEILPILQDSFAPLLWRLPETQSASVLSLLYIPINTVNSLINWDLILNVLTLGEISPLYLSLKSLMWWIVVHIFSHFWNKTSSLYWKLYDFETSMSFWVLSWWFPVFFWNQQIYLQKALFQILYKHYFKFDISFHKVNAHLIALCCTIHSKYTAPIWKRFFY